MADRGPSPRKAIPLRIEPALHDAIARCATIHLRSVNAEIETLLREALERRGVKVKQAEPRRRGRPPADEAAKEER